MAITANSTHLTFDDSTTQTTAINAAPGPTVVVFTSPGVYSRPPTIRGVVVTMVGGGAAGMLGYSNSSPTYPGVFFPGVTSAGGSGGAGAGTTIRKWPLASLPPSIPVVVGQGGVSTSPTYEGTMGTNSEFNVAPGVYGGSQYATRGGFPTDAGSGFGPSIGSDIYMEGGNGLLRPIGGASAPGVGSSGGSSFFGSGGSGGFRSGNFTIMSNVGKAYGSGGAGGPSANPTHGPVVAYGANGAPGIVIIEEYY